MCYVQCPPCWNLRLHEKWVRRTVPWTRRYWRSRVSSFLSLRCFDKYLLYLANWLFLLKKKKVKTLTITFPRYTSMLGRYYLLRREREKCSDTAVIRIGFVHRSMTVKHPWIISASKQNLTCLMISFCLVGWLKCYDNLKGSCNSSAKWLFAEGLLFLHKHEGN